VPRLKCREGERVREDAGNTVKSVQVDHGGRRREARHRLEGERDGTPTYFSCQFFRSLDCNSRRVFIVDAQQGLTEGEALGYVHYCSVD
jgi:hypothetical protein